MSLSIREALQLQDALAAVGDLRARVAALETRLPPKGESRGNEALREAIRQILEVDHGPLRGTAKRVEAALANTDIGRREKPSRRTIQWYITQLRALRR